MIVSTEDFAFFWRLQLKTVAQFEHSLCFAQTKDLLSLRGKNL